MITKVFVFFTLIFFISFSTTSSHAAADIAAGKVVVENSCQTCHGFDGIATTPVAANLAGQQKIYLKIQLENYRSGKRQHEQMSIIAQMLSDDDIDNVAAYYSNINFTIEMPE